MLTPRAVLDSVKAEPVRTSRIQMASGRSFDIRHPEMIKILKSYFIVSSSTGGTLDIPDEFETVSLMLAESISHLEVPVA